jgi:hypothetical protein
MADDAPWTRERLQKMIDDRIEESFQLDYKAADALSRTDSGKKEITKDVSAFANSSGGTIIYGIKEFSDPEKKHLPEKLDPVDGKAFTREWLDQVLNEIDPHIENLRITPVRVGPPDENTCYVVEIPKGDTCHQAGSLRYYRRSNFECQALRDHEIQDIKNRRKNPLLELTVHLFKTTDCTLKVNLCVKNKGIVIPNRYQTEVLLPQWIQGYLAKKDLMVCTRGIWKLWRFVVPGVETSFPNSDAYSEYEIPYHVTHQPAPPDPPDQMICTLYADSMPPLIRQIPVEAALRGWT